MKSLVLIIAVASLCGCSSMGMGDSSGASDSSMSRGSTYPGNMSNDYSNPSNIYFGG